jgi:hypothetical protein
MSDNIFYTTVLPVLNSSEIEVTDWILKYYLDELWLQRVRTPGRENHTNGIVWSLFFF